MKYRKLRIAWSVAWGLVAVLLCVLWVRSYSTNDHLAIRTGSARHSNVVLLSNWGFIQALFNQTIDVSNVQHFNQPAWERTDVGFEWRGDGAIKVPDVFAVVAVISSVCPWLNYKRFSLRTLLVATTLVAVVLGAIIYATRG